MDETKNKKEDNATIPSQAPGSATNVAANNLADDPILNASSINSEDYWFLKLSGNDN